MNQEHGQRAEILRLIQAAIDQSVDQRIAQLEQERSERHAEAARMLESLLAASGESSASIDPPTLPDPPQQNLLPQAASDNGASSPRKLFKMRDAVVKVIEPLSDDTDIHQHLIYNLLVEQHPELREREEITFRSQIVGILNKLAEQGGILTRVKVGTGKAQNIYRKNTYKPMIGAIEASGGVIHK